MKYLRNKQWLAMIGGVVVSTLVTGCFGANGNNSSNAASDDHHDNPQVTPTLLSFAIDDYPGKISNDQVALTVPFNSYLLQRKPVFSFKGEKVYVGDMEQQSGSSEQDFTKPLTYSVVAGSQAANYTVTVTPAAQVFFNPRKLAMNESGTIAYVVNSGSSGSSPEQRTIYSCDVGRKGNLVNCRDSGGRGFIKPVSIAVRKDGKTAYISDASHTDEGWSAIYACEISPDGYLLQNCHNAAPGRVTQTSYGLALNADDRMLYAGGQDDYITLCRIDDIDTGLTCVNSDPNPDLEFARNLVITPDSKFLITTNSVARDSKDPDTQISEVVVCPLINDNSLVSQHLGPCSVGGIADLNLSQDLVLNPRTHKLHILNQNDTVVSCTYTENEQGVSFSNCQHDKAPQTVNPKSTATASGLGIAPAGNYIYISDVADAGKLIKCSLGTSLTQCQMTGFPVLSSESTNLP